jgi:hypothetical protein
MKPTDEPARMEQHDEEIARLPDEAVVVRFGVAAPDTLRKSALAQHDETSDFGLSVVSLPGKSADELARLAGLRHPKIRETTVATIRRAGYEVVPDEPPEGHALIMLPRLPTDDDYQRVSDVFSPPRPNPVLEAHA